ncbi:MAG: hypothetical protein H8E20_10730 [Verrucomicrobia bacterium]|nr:hypothetical protein [Verrucomicrobiota bacterium]
MAGVLEGDEPFGFKLKGAFELFVRLGFEEGVIGGEVGEVIISVYLWEADIPSSLPVLPSKE